MEGLPLLLQIILHRPGLRFALTVKGTDGKKFSGIVCSLQLIQAPWRAVRVAYLHVDSLALFAPELLGRALRFIKVEKVHIRALL